MTNFDILAQYLAAFVLHALWQVPLLAGAAWCALRIGRPDVRLAHRIWAATLALCVTLPLVATIVARHAAIQAQHDAANAHISYDSMNYPGELPTMQREAAWVRLLHRHLSVRDGLQPFAFAVPMRWARVLAGVYLLFAALFFCQLMAAWLRIRSLVKGSSEAVLPVCWASMMRQQFELQSLCEVPVRCSERVVGPALAGVIRPVLLLPAVSVADLRDEEFKAILLHELAHLRRHDPVLHAVCSLLLLPVAFHPLAWWVARSVRQTREMACDADAAEEMGSHAAYARSLLHVAERIGRQRLQRSVLGFFSNGLLGADLQLFNGNGAMEERMRKLTEAKKKETRGRHTLRVTAGVSLGAVAVLAAGMLQVRPALAVERVTAQDAAPVRTASSDQTVDSNPRLLSGDHAREQLRQARRDLAKAEQRATSDDDRRKISTARGIAAAAESALAQAGNPGRDLSPQVDLSRLQVQLSDLKLPDIDISMSHLTPQQEAYLQSPEWKANLAKQQAYFNSPEWKANIERQRAYFDSPEWKANIEKQHAYFNSPEWKATLEQQQQAMQKLRAQMSSPEWRAKIEASVRDAKQQADHAMQRMQSVEIQRGIDQANQLMARNEFPAPVAGNEADGPVKVSPGVMSGNATHKEPPVYPVEAKEKKIQGAVLLHAIISEDGKVEQLSVVSSPDELLSKSAIEAVHKWTYKPYLLNGQPTSVDTTITVTYSFAP